MNSTSKSKLDTLIFQYWGTKENAAEYLNISRGTMHRWMNQDPKRFFNCYDLFKERGVGIVELAEAIEDHESK
jgi:hypothetical protein